MRSHVAPTHNLGHLGNLFEFWEISTVLLNFGINKDLELVPSHFIVVSSPPCGGE